MNENVVEFTEHNKDKKTSVIIKPVQLQILQATFGTGLSVILSGAAAAVDFASCCNKIPHHTSMLIGHGWVNKLGWPLGQILQSVVQTCLSKAIENAAACGWIW